VLHGYGPKQGNKQYLKILELAAKESQSLVNECLRFLIKNGNEVYFEVVEAMVKSHLQPPAITDLTIDQVDLTIYDQLLEYSEVLSV
jgi:hypothetical protein